jgi:hypothetical protein
VIETEQRIDSFMYWAGQWSVVAFVGFTLDIERLVGWWNASYP